MAVAAPRRLRSGSLSSEEASYSEDEENGGRLRSFVSQVRKFYKSLYVCYVQIRFFIVF